jgi:hypothetical protein
MLRCINHKFPYWENIQVKGLVPGTTRAGQGKKTARSMPGRFEKQNSI